MNKHFVLRSEPVRLIVIAWVKQVPIVKPFIELVARPFKSLRTLRQNALYWRTVNLAAPDLGYAPAELHEILLARYFGTKEIRLFDIALTVPAERSKNQNTKKFAEFYEWGVSFMVQELGVRLPA